jgi:LuxR family transcriptional regulator, maltose regulon positive regulatory protein
VAFFYILSTPEEGAVILVENLTGTEQKVLGHLVKGLKNREIAEAENFSEGYVEQVNVRIYGKLGVTSRAQAVVKALQLGLVKL